MTRYAVRRLLWMIPVLWAAATLVWIFMFLIPGDPARILAGQSADPDVLAAVREEWGLDRPAPVRYAHFLAKLARFDLGTSYVQQGRPVTGIIGAAMVRTLFLAITATLLASALGIFLGTLSAAWRGTLIDHVLRGATAAGISVPTFWLGLMLMLVFASGLGWFPVSGYGDGPTILGIRFPGFMHLVLPSVTLAIFSSCYLARVTRASLLEESNQEYPRAARARGVTETAAIWRHALANAMLPVVTLVGLNFGALLGGAIATETIFSWPGVGLVMLNALKNRDLPVLEGGAIALTGSFLLVNAAVDLSYALLDPRTRRD
jgi:peptide/nickel transport system permease protein